MRILSQRGYRPGRLLLPVRRQRYSARQSGGAVPPGFRFNQCGVPGVAGLHGLLLLWRTPVVATGNAADFFPIIANRHLRGMARQ